MTKELLGDDTVGCALQLWNPKVMQQGLSFGQTMSLSDQVFGLGANWIEFAGSLSFQRNSFQNFVYFLYSNLKFRFS